MDILSLQKDVYKVVEDCCAENDLTLNKGNVMRKLFEEIGELSEASLGVDGETPKRKRVSSEQAHQNLEDEAADVLGVLLVIAEMYNLDIKKAVERKWLTYLK